MLIIKRDVWNIIVQHIRGYLLKKEQLNNCSFYFISTKRNFRDALIRHLP